MVHGNKKIFLDRDKLTQMLNLRINGFATTSLSVIFGVNRSSIENQCDKYWVKPLDEVITIERIVSNVLPPPKKSHWIVVDGERINQGKSYREYLEESRKYAHR